MQMKAASENQIDKDCLKLTFVLEIATHLFVC